MAKVINPEDPSYLRDRFLSSWSESSVLNDGSIGSTKMQRLGAALEEYLTTVIGDGRTRIKVAFVNVDNVGERQSNGWKVLTESDLVALSGDGDLKFTEAKKNSFGLVTDASDRLKFSNDIVIAVMPEDIYISIINGIQQRSSQIDKDLWGKQNKEYLKQGYTKEPVKCTKQVMHFKEDPDSVEEG